MQRHFFFPRLKPRYSLENMTEQWAPNIMVIHFSIKNNVKGIIKDHAFLADKYIIPASHYFQLLNIEC